MLTAITFLVASCCYVVDDSLVRPPVPTGHTVMIGGRLRGDNRELYEKIIQLAGGSERARFVILPSASMEADAGTDFKSKLALYGIPDSQVLILNVVESNRAVSTASLENISAIDNATAVFFSGGDQRRLTRVLIEADGTDSALLAAIRKLYQRGGLVAGTSAGAAAQSAKMIAVSGLPDRLLDDGMDALDFGIKNDSRQRGLFLTQGLGLFQAGIIDQHFYQYRGRLGRLIRAISATDTPYGFGIDENTALIASSEGMLEVCGSGYVTVVQAGHDRGTDGPWGYQIQGVSLSLMSHGDRFPLSSGEIIIPKWKSPLNDSDTLYNGNFLLGDIGAASQTPYALIYGLIENRSRVQESVVVKYHGETSHGYRFRFVENQRTRSYSGSTLMSSYYSLSQVGLDILPIANGLKPSNTQVPIDLADDPNRHILAAVAHRGIMESDKHNGFRPHQVMTRGEFALAMARSVHLEAVPDGQSLLIDVDLTSLEGLEIQRAVHAGLLGTDDRQALRPDESLSAANAHTGLSWLAQRNNFKPDDSIWSGMQAMLKTPEATVTRSHIGTLIHQILQLPK